LIGGFLHQKLVTLVVTKTMYRHFMTLYLIVLGLVLTNVIIALFKYYTN
jgi:tetrahydromethanopterin S-methyltransferase subunit G